MTTENRGLLLMQQIAAERKKSQQMRQLYTLGAACIGLFAAGYLYRQAHAFDYNVFAGELAAEAQATIWPSVRDAAQKVGSEALPALGAAMSVEAAELLPAIHEMLVTESGTLQENSRGRMMSAMDTQFAAQMDKHGDELKAAYPTIKDDSAEWEKLATGAKGQCTGWAQQELDRTFDAHIAVLANMDAKVNEIVKSATAKGEMAPERDAESLVMMFLELMDKRLSAGEK